MNENNSKTTKPKPKFLSNQGLSTNMSDVVIKTRKNCFFTIFKRKLFVSLDFYQNSKQKEGKKRKYAQFYSHCASFPQKKTIYQKSPQGGMTFDFSEK